MMVWDATVSFRVNLLALEWYPAKTVTPACDVIVDHKLTEGRTVWCMMGCLISWRFIGGSASISIGQEGAEIKLAVEQLNKRDPLTRLLLLLLLLLLPLLLPHYSPHTIQHAQCASCKRGNPQLQLGLACVILVLESMGVGLLSFPPPSDVRLVSQSFLCNACLPIHPLRLL